MMSLISNAMLTCSSDFFSIDSLSDRMSFFSFFVFAFCAAFVAAFASNHFLVEISTLATVLTIAGFGVFFTIAAVATQKGDVQNKPGRS